jgi:hypothetical protein
MPYERDWRDADACAYLHDLGAAAFAWEATDLREWAERGARRATSDPGGTTIPPAKPVDKASRIGSLVAEKLKQALLGHDLNPIPGASYDPVIAARSGSAQSSNERHYLSSDLAARPLAGIAPRTVVLPGSDVDCLAPRSAHSVSSPIA